MLQSLGIVLHFPWVGRDLCCALMLALALFLPSPLQETYVLEHLEIIILLIYGNSFNKAAGVLLTLAKLWQTRKSLFVFLIFNPVNRAREMQHNRYR